MKDLLKQLCMIDGVPGYEDEVRECIEEIVKPYAKEMFSDSIGNLFVLKKGKKVPKRPIMVCAHMDEVGFLVSSITEDGMIKISPAGGIDPRVLIGRRMTVGPKKITGIISLKAIHLTTPEERTVAPGINSLYVDIGSSSKAQTEKLVSVADQVTFASEFIEFGDQCIKAKAIDDRLGCAAMIKLMEKELPHDTWFVFTTNEEIGMRGARIAAQRLNPGVIMAIEGTTAADMPDVEQHRRSTTQREGAVISLMDRGTVYSRALRDKITGIADERGVKWQYRRSANGATDVGQAHTAADGAYTFGLAAPVRYIHCACNVVHMPDVEQVLKVAEIFLEEAGDFNV